MSTYAPIKTSLNNSEKSKRGSDAPPSKTARLSLIREVAEARQRFAAEEDEPEEGYDMYEADLVDLFKRAGERE